MAYKISIYSPTKRFEGHQEEQIDPEETISFTIGENSYLVTIVGDELKISKQAITAEPMYILPEVSNVIKIK